MAQSYFPLRQQSESPIPTPLAMEKQLDIEGVQEAFVDHKNRYAIVRFAIL